MSAPSPTLSDPEGFVPLGDEHGAFVAHAGPFHARGDVLGVRVEDRHLNAAGTAMGGFLATFVDVAFGRAVRGDRDDDPAVATVSLTTDFLRPGPRGAWVEAHTEVERLSGRLAFVDVRVGLLHVFCRHTSAGLTLNENASPDVRRDLRTWFDDAVPEEFAWTHTLEGSDDMPAHVKSSLVGPDLTIPVTDGRLALGTWQGITLCEYRDRGGARELVLTLSGTAV